MDKHGQEKTALEVEAQERSEATRLKLSRTPTPEQEVAEREAVRLQLETLKQLASPLVAWIREHHGPLTEVHISWDHVSVKQDGISIPFPYSES